MRLVWMSNSTLTFWPAYGVRSTVAVLYTGGEASRSPARPLNCLIDVKSFASQGVTPTSRKSTGVPSSSAHSSPAYLNSAAAVVRPVRSMHGLISDVYCADG